MKVESNKFRPSLNLSNVFHFHGIPKQIPASTPTIIHMRAQTLKNLIVVQDQNYQIFWNRGVAFWFHWSYTCVLKTQIYPWCLKSEFDVEYKTWRMYDDAARQRGEQEGTPVKKHFEEDDLWWWIMTILMRQKRFLPFFNDSNFMLSSQRQVVTRTMRMIVVWSRQHYRSHYLFMFVFFSLTNSIKNKSK